MDSKKLFINSISVVEDELTVLYEKHNGNGLFEQKSVFYSFKNGLQQIDNTVISEDNKYMLSHEINGALSDLEEMEVI